METTTAEQTRDLVNRIIAEYSDKNVTLAAARISRETGMAPGYIRTAYSRGGLSYWAYRSIGIILLGEDPGPPENIHPEAEAILLTHGVGLGGE